MSELVLQAFEGLYPEKAPKYNFYIKYSNHFKPYNANVKLYGNNMTFHFSKEWRKISKEIQIGLVQELLCKILHDKKKTVNMDLYNLFLKNVHIAIPKTDIDPVLQESFGRVNEKYLNGMAEMPNLVWGNDSTSKLGCYEYGSDTITISSIFKNAPTEMLDYIMHHEMLHKKFKFSSNNGRTVHHGPEFRRMEGKFDNKGQVEKDVMKLARRHKSDSKGF